MKQRITAVQGQPKGKSTSFLNMIGLGTTLCSPTDSMDVQVSEMEGPAATDICNIKLATSGELILLILLLFFFSGQLIG